MARRRTWRKDRQPVQQTTPTFQKLLERYESGLKSRKEITRRVLAGPPNKADEQTTAAFEALKAVALENGWIQE